MSFIGDVALLIRAIRVGFRVPPFERPDYPDPIPIPAPILAPPEPVPVPEPLPVPVAVAPRDETPNELSPPFGWINGRPKRRAELKRDLLDNLEAYQIYIKRLRLADPEAYTTYKRVGAFVLPPDMLSHRYELEPGVLSRLPAFGAIAFGPDDVQVLGRDGQAAVPVRFAWVTKLERPGHYVERRAGGTVYRCSAYFDDAKDAKIRDAKSGVTNTYMVHVAPDGTITPLRMKLTETQVIKHKRGVGRGRRGANNTVVSHQRWGLPEISDRKDISRADSIRETFCLVMNFWVQAASQSMIRVTATRDKIVMPFVVDVLDTPGFFKDRETMIDEGGRKKRIFHVVKGHVRATGAVVKMHFRGLREFVWNSYQIKIVVPGRDTRDIADFQLGAHEDTPADEMEGMQPIEIVASTIIADAINGVVAR